MILSRRQMRLLNTTTGSFELFDDPRTVQYAILSHVWSKPGDPHYPEQTYEKIEAIQKTPKSPTSWIPGFGWLASASPVLAQFSQKIQNACRAAREHGLDWIWIDSGCIDKRSSAEVTLSINSMFDWYRYATVCYAFLYDVHDTSRPRSKDSEFGRSLWFTRGWTLQELLAPHVVIFVSHDWKPIGTKHSLASVIEEITSIDRAVLRKEKELFDVPVARRMSWASGRQTTLDEDKAYCLVGLFGVRLAPIYGEGAESFLRLQEAISRNIQDQTMLAWGTRKTLKTHKLAAQGETASTGGRAPTPAADVIGYEETYLFASSPASFSVEACAPLVPVSPQDLLSTLGVEGTFYPEYTTTAYGIRTRLPLAPFWSTEGSTYYLAFLACQVDHPEPRKKRFVALLLRHLDNSLLTSAEFTVGFLPCPPKLTVNTYHAHNLVVPTLLSKFYRLISLSEEEIAIHRGTVKIADVYIPYRPSDSLQARARDAPFLKNLVERPPKQSLVVELPAWRHALLQLHGFEVTTSKSHNGDVLSLQDRRRTDKGLPIRIEIAPCQCSEDWIRVTVTPRSQALPFSNSHRDHDEVGRAVCKFWEDHVYSWHLRDRVASRLLRFESPVGRVHGVRLTLTVDIQRRGAHSPTESLRHYHLDIEIHEDGADFPPLDMNSAKMGSTPTSPVAPLVQSAPWSANPHASTDHTPRQPRSLTPSRGGPSPPRDRGASQPPFQETRRAGNTLGGGSKVEAPGMGRTRSRSADGTERPAGLGGLEPMRQNSFLEMSPNPHTDPGSEYQDTSFVDPARLSECESFPMDSITRTLILPTVPQITQRSGYGVSVFHPSHAQPRQAGDTRTTPAWLVNAPASQSMNNRSASRYVEHNLRAKI